MINSRKIEDLHPRVQVLCKEFISKCKEAGINVLITSTYRDDESQNALYEQGRTKPGKIVTKARAGQSYHNYRLAFDFCPMIDKKCAWDRIDLFKKCGEIAENIGLEWGGNFKTIKDTPHCQFTGGLSLQDLRDGKFIA